MLPRIDTIDSEFRNSLLQQIDEIVRRDANIEAALDVVDKEVLVGMLGIEPDWCRACREIWKKLQRRRLGRA